MSTITELMPRHNLLTIFGGETQEEVDLKAGLTEKMLAENYPDFEFLPKEAILDMTDASEFVDLDKWVKFFNVTVRVQRVRGSFIIGALIDKLTNIVPIEKTMREACTNQSGTNSDALRGLSYPVCRVYDPARRRVHVPAALPHGPLCVP